MKINNAFIIFGNEIYFTEIEALFLNIIFCKISLLEIQYRKTILLLRNGLIKH